MDPVQALPGQQVPGDLLHRRPKARVKERHRVDEVVEVLGVDVGTPVLNPEPTRPCVLVTVGREPLLGRKDPQGLRQGEDVCREWISPRGVLNEFIGRVVRRPQRPV